ncbi:DUF1376 domain-containing protein [Methylobacterium longum]|uniref:DUF1376 domain-containing protein n=1 Tax=Methylobacterium longum TaxID=767694 RepID=A0ABT8AYX1_9HYPH|nr:DUF1376 domain-containing protein [Methylobacterium longum]MDN3574640.1 DUF1376 domain-containing protein [Methylobacterium longum]GJE13672.1 hypothetical protein FOHLNKBM_4736 [Methylobacterium longum]
MTQRDDLPAPLVPADIDIAGLSSFLLDIDRLFHSELWALSTGEEFKAAVALWGHAWRQRPAGSLPNDDRLLAAFSGAGGRWKKVKAIALRGFVLCSDNRFYHRVLCEDVLRAAKSKDARRERTAAATRARQAKVDPDQTPPSGGKKTNDVNETVDRNVGRNGQRNEGSDEQRHDVRHERRDETVAITSRSPLHSPIAGHSSTEEEHNPAGACEPVPRAPTAAAPPLAWNCRENFDRVERRCREVLPRDWVQDLVVSPMARLEASGVDLEAEIVPVLLDLVAARRVPIRTWTLLADTVAERVAVQRQGRTAQGLPATPSAPTPPGDMVDLGVSGRWPEPTLRKWIERFRQDAGAWSEAVLGPPPGQLGCRIPSRLLLEAA